MKDMIEYTPIRVLLATALAVFLSACAATGKAPSTTISEGPEAAAAPTEPWDGDGMEIPLDGSSLEAFDRSLARVQAHTTEENYQTLKNAIDYLLFYDLAAQRDRAKVAANLDGLTGYEVLEKVSWRKPMPGKSPAEKDAADAKIIDT